MRSAWGTQVLVLMLSLVAISERECSLAAFSIPVAGVVVGDVEEIANSAKSRGRSRQDIVIKPLVVVVRVQTKQRSKRRGAVNMAICRRGEGAEVAVDGRVGMLCLLRLSLLDDVGQCRK